MRRLNRRVPEGYRTLDHFLREILTVTRWPGLSQADLARYLDCDAKNVWRWLIAKNQVPDDVTISEMENWRLKKLTEARARARKT